MPGDLLFIGSDGITEAARGGDIAAGQFGEEELVAVLRQHAAAPLNELKSALLDRLEAHTAGIYHDDVSFVVVRAATAPAYAA